MTYLENPFTPSFGEVPDHLAGRHDIVRRFDRAFSAPPPSSRAHDHPYGSSRHGQDHAAFLHRP